MVNALPDHTYIMKPPLKPPNQWCLESLRLVSTRCARRVVWPETARKLEPCFIASQKYGRPRAFDWHLKWNTVCEIEPLNAEALWEVSVRTALSCWIHSWCLENQRIGCWWWKILQSETFIIVILKAHSHGTVVFVELTEVFCGDWYLNNDSF